MTNQIIARYLNKFDELNVLLGKEKQEIKELEDFLLDAYIEGFISNVFTLGLEVDIPKNYKEKVLNWSYKEIDKETNTEKIESVREKIINYVDNEKTTDLKRLIESELHRAYNEGAFDSASLINDEYGINMKKVWVTMADDKVRDTHAYLEGMSVDLYAEFVTYDGDSALFPGGFKMAQNNANCRCILVYSNE